jgi:hypothetical protein
MIAEMSNPIAEIFTRSLPSIPGARAEAFADGILTYFNAFKTRR